MGGRQSKKEMEDGVLIGSLSLGTMSSEAFLSWTAGCDTTPPEVNNPEPPGHGTKSSEARFSGQGTSTPEALIGHLERHTDI